MTRIPQNGDRPRHRLMKTFLLAMLLNARAAVAQTVTPTVMPPASVTMSDPLSPRTAPVGHRQPGTKDVVFDEASMIERIDAESAALDRKLRICRGC